VKIIGETNLAAMVAADASALYARNVLDFTEADRSTRKLKPPIAHRSRRTKSCAPRCCAPAARLAKY
jgi:hypothetical protein